MSERKKGDLELSSSEFSLRAGIKPGGCLLKTDDGDRLMANFPFVSVILPIRNEAAFIEESLGSVIAQDYPPDRMEVLVVDGMSDDATREIVQRVIDQRRDVNGSQSLSIKSQNKLSIGILENPRRIVPTGLNSAIAQARGDIIVRVDGHTVIAPNYVSQTVAALQRTEADVVGGLMTAVGQGLVGETIALVHRLRFGLGGGLFHRATKETDADTVFMGSFRRQVFNRVGLFNEELVRNQDIELNTRVRLSGGRVVLSPLIRSTYSCSDSFRALWRKNYANGLWLCKTVTVTPGALSLRHFTPLLFVVSLLLSLIAVVWLRPGWVLLALVAGSYLIALSTASIVAAARYGWRYLLSLPLVFLTLHISYGIGSLVGALALVGDIIKQSHPWRKG